MGITYLDGSRLRRAMIAGCDFARCRRAELNRINVFPVPDGDTGTNLALTVGSIAERLRGNVDDSAAAVARVAAEAGILGARGNCGMILSHFLHGFAAATGDRARLGVAEFSAALRAAVDHLYGAIERPVEGTILTVMREAAEEAETVRAGDFVELMERVVARARGALAWTSDLLPALRRAGVVDAGAKGFVHFLEGIAALVKGDPVVALPEPESLAESLAEALVEAGPAAARVEYPADSERYRFCTEALVRGGALPTAAAVRQALAEAGDSLIVIRGAEVLKVHVHTDAPERVFAYLRTIGELATHKAEDMAAQHAAVERAAAGHVRRDRVDITADAFVDRLRRGEHPTTSQPPPAAFYDAFERALEDGERVLVTLVAAALSGTFASAEAAARRFDGEAITLFDSRGASLTEGLLVLRAAELAELGWALPAIVAELDRIRDRSGIFFTVDVFENLLASGRVGRGRAWLGTLLDIKPVLGLDASGRVIPLARVRGRRNVLPKVMDLLESRLPRDTCDVRFGILHVGCEEVVAEVRAALRDRYGEREVIVSPATAVLATHVGPGAWGLAYQRED